MKRRILLSTGLLALLAACGQPAAAADLAAPALVGTWTLVAADVIHRDGSRGRDYGDTPKGLLMIDTQGHYSLQIYDSLRPHYASGDRARGTATEYQANTLGISTHFGTLQVDAATGVLTLNIESARSPTRMASNRSASTSWTLTN
ncbi:MAG: lipocalin-like domain protein [Gammaproteobacteria bacterium]|nr:lipocalin-like domain protein [Gammaproteobacteria bacterium]